MTCVRLKDGERCHKPVDEYITTELAKAYPGDQEFFVEVALCEECYAELQALRRKQGRRV